MAEIPPLPTAEEESEQRRRFYLEWAVAGIISCDHVGWELLSAFCAARNVCTKPFTI